MIKIKSVRLKNFKCFENLPQFDLGRLTFITGANSAGKSSLMYSVLGVLQSDNFPFQFTANGKYVKMGSYNDMVFCHEEDKNIVIDVIFEKDGVQYNTKTTLAKPDQGTQPVVSEFVGSADYFNISLSRHIENGSIEYLMDLRYDSSLNELAKKKSDAFVDNFRNIVPKEGLKPGEMNDILNMLRSWVGPIDVKDIKVIQTDKGLTTEDHNASAAMSMVLSDISELFKGINRDLNFVTSFRAPAERVYLETTLKDGKLTSSGEGFVMELLNWRDKDRRKYEGIIEQLRNLGVLYDIEPKRLEGGNFQVDVKVRRDGVFANLSDVGFGVSQVLPVVVADMELSNGSTLMTAQPEIHLHPSVQANLGDYFVQQINNSNKNYVVETHSEYLLNRLRLEIAKGTLNADDIRVYYINLEEGKTKMHHVKFCKNGQIEGAPEDFFETYMMDVMNLAMTAE